VWLAGNAAFVVVIAAVLFECGTLCDGSDWP